MLVLDANILIRAILGVRVPVLLTKYARHVEFYAPDTAFQEAVESLPSILKRRGIPVPPALHALETLRPLIQTVEADAYSRFEAEAKKRLGRRDPDDWPILATALLLDCPIWTEDTDFFGCGVATWTSDLVELYLAEYASRHDSQL
ncbi:MAG: PIN domain-containing protein [Bryobacteraceae bacterium]